VKRFLFAVPALLALTGCLTGCGTSATTTSALTEAQIAAYAVVTGYTIAAQAELSIGPTLSPNALKAMQAADAAAYKWVSTLSSEAQSGSVVAADLASGQTALASLNSIVKGTSP